MAGTFSEPTENSKNCTSFLVSRKPRTSFLNSVWTRTSNGTSFLSTAHTLVVCGRQQWRAWRVISRKLSVKPNSPWRSSQQSWHKSRLAWVLDPWHPWTHLMMTVSRASHLVISWLVNLSVLYLTLHYPIASCRYYSIGICVKTYLVHHLWKRWSGEYWSSLNKFNKWHYPSRNLTVGDVVILKEDRTLPTRWPFGRVIQVYPGVDDFVPVASVKTAQGVFKKPVTKLALLLPQEEQ